MVEFEKCETQVRRLIERANESTSGELDTEVLIQNIRDEWDSSLQAKENLTIVMNYLNDLLGDFKQPTKAELTELTKAQEEAEQKAESERALQELREKEGKAIEVIKTNANPNLDKYFYNHIQLLRLIKNGFANGYICVSNGGLGKSHLTEIELEGTKSIVIKGYITPLKLYEILYQYCDGYVIVFDDCRGLIEDIKALSILKSALWGVGNVRKVAYYSSTDKLSCPSSFEFTSRVVVLTNRIAGGVDLDAMKSRCLFLELEFTPQQKMEMFYEFAKLDYARLDYKERIEVVDFITDLDKEAIKNLNFRLLLHIFAIRKYCKQFKLEWKGLALSQLDIDTDIKLIKELLAKHSLVKEACREFCETTGLSRRTFFSLKSKLFALNCTSFALENRDTPIICDRGSAVLKD